MIGQIYMSAANITQNAFVPTEVTGGGFNLNDSFRLEGYLIGIAFRQHKQMKCSYLK